MTQEMALKIVNAMDMLYPLMYLGASCFKKAKVAMIPPIFPNPTCQADPTERLWWPPRSGRVSWMNYMKTGVCLLMLNQHTMIGIALNAPDVTRKSAPYWTERLSCTPSRIAKPVIQMKILKMANRNRCRTLSLT